jgi:hypothetical protein
MSEAQATAIAQALGGEAWHSGGGIWLALFISKDGRMVVISEDAVCEYDDKSAFDEGKVSNTIVLQREP